MLELRGCLCTSKASLLMRGGMESVRAWYGFSFNEVYDDAGIGHTHLSNPHPPTPEFEDDNARRNTGQTNTEARPRIPKLHTGYRPKRTYGPGILYPIWKRKMGLSTHNW